MHGDTKDRLDSPAQRAAAAPPHRSIYHFYGYDPRGSRFYDRLLRENIASQSGAAGPFPASSVRRKRDSLFTTVQVSTRRGGAKATASVSLVRWRSFIAETMIRENVALILNGYACVSRMLVRGVVFNMFRMNEKFAGVLAGLFLIPVALSLAAGGALLYALPDLPTHGQVLAGLAILAAIHLGYWAIMLAPMYPRFFLWGMSFYSSIGGLSRRIDDHLPAYDEILDRSAEAIAAEMSRHPEREYLLVGHSAGAILAIEVAGRLIERYGETALAERVRLITLGGAWAFLSAYPGPRAAKHREYVAVLAATPLIDWADVVATEDVLSVPNSANRMRRILRREPPAFNRFSYVDPRYSKILGYWHWRVRTLNFVLMHLQYLLTPMRRGRYNYLNFIYNPWGESASELASPSD